MICFLKKTGNDNMLKKLRTEIDTVLSKLDKFQDLTLEDTDEFVYLKQCYNESLRLETPIGNTSTFFFTQDTKLGGFNIKKGTEMMFSLFAAHMCQD
jgi:cytochrome P450